MKKIIVIGEDSYIGLSFYEFSKEKFEIKLVNSRDNAWKNVDFSGYDSVLHCAGIAHVSRDPKMAKLYYEVNCDLAVAVAEKAKRENVKQFIYLSSILVYGNNKNEITVDTQPDPSDFYGGSKLRAEQELLKLNDESFKLCLVRQPMVYGKNCKGNFPRLVGLAGKTPVFPDFPNKRSMIYIDNLCSFYNILIDKEKDGIFFPQNKEYVSTTDIVKCMASLRGRRILFTRIFNSVIRLFRKFIPVFSKLFGDLYYTWQGDEEEYNVASFEESIERSINSVIARSEATWQSRNGATE